MSTPTKILAVDDNPSNLVAFQAVFSGSEYQIIEAQSGAEAVSLLQKNNDIAVVLLDVQMPNMDGFQTAAMIKQIPGYEALPIIFITAVYNEDPFVKKGYQMGAVDYFSKPFDPDILKLKVGIYASLKHKANLLEERVKRITETEELLKAGRKLSSILESLTVGVLIADSNGNICQSNEAATKILNSYEAVKSDSYGEILGWWDKQGQILKGKDSPLSLAITVGKSSHNEKIDIECQDGTSKTIVASASPLKNTDQAIVGAVVVIQDLTETKKMEEDLEDRISSLISLGVEFEHFANPH